MLSQAKLWFDPIDVVIKAFNRLYPGRSAVVMFEPGLKERDDCYGLTLFPDDNPGEPTVFVDTAISMECTVEVLAHELAHVAEPDDEHGPKWEAAFDAIHKAYCEAAEASENELAEVTRRANEQGWSNITD